VMHVVGGNSIAGATAVTPGGAGVNEAVSVVALSHYTDAQTATAFAVDQHLVGTAWNIVFALILVPIVAPTSGTRSKTATASPSGTGYGTWVATRTAVVTEPAMTLIKRLPET